ncbi:cupin domain-containing protein [Hyphococcus sp.]|uniref:cupin domain-containing protein n=1 Tax=Hyphococcus sp. TaxID=2038636 RepID=UPI0035C75776
MFWRREGGPLDIKDNSLMAWLLRFVAALLVAAVVVMMFRLGAPKASAEEGASKGDSLPYALDAGWKGEKVCELLFENDDTRVGRCTFPPGVGHERHYHPPHYGYILKGGTMRITDADGTRDAETPDGASWWSPGVEWHEAINVGDTTAVYLIFEPKSAAAVTVMPE